MCVMDIEAFTCIHQNITKLHSLNNRYQDCKPCQWQNDVFELAQKFTSRFIINQDNHGQSGV